MKKVSTKLFFSVMWKGVCQAVAWFFGLFGYKRNGKYAKAVWRVFATSAAIVMLLIACTFIYVLLKEARFEHNGCEDPDCIENTFVSHDIYYHDHEDGKGYIFNALTGERTVKHIAWIAKPLGEDSLVCYSDGKKRGYFNKFTGKVAIPAKYDHAWIFSDGLASVEEDGFINFIDATGKVVIETNQRYHEWMDGYVFHGGYCVINNEDNDLYALIDKTGKTVLPAEYKNILVCNDSLICVEKGNEMGVLNKNLKPVLPMMECIITACDETIDVVMPNNTIRKYDLSGKLIDGYYIRSVRMLEYETDAVVYIQPQRADQEPPCVPADEESEWSNGVNDEDATYYHPKATAHLRAYTAGNDYEGLMTADGHIVTLPSYYNIEAIGPDLYLCQIDYSSSIVLNGKGQVVK